MGDFPSPSSGLELEESSRLLTAVICGLWELPRTRFLHRCCFFAESDEFQGSQELGNCQQRACGSGKEKAAAGSTLPVGPCCDPPAANHRGRKVFQCTNSLPCGVTGSTAEMSGDEEGSQSFKGLWIKTVGVAYERSFAKSRTQMARNSSPPPLPS